MVFKRPLSFFALIVGIVLSVSVYAPVLWAAAGVDTGLDSLDSGLGANNGSGGLEIETPLLPGQTKTPPANQSEYGNNCASGGMGNDYSSTCGHPGAQEEPPPKQDDGVRGNGCKASDGPNCNDCPIGKVMRNGVCETARAKEDPRPEEDPYAACRGPALQAISRCESGYAGAQSSCATTRVDGVVAQANAANEGRLQSNAANTAQTCGGTAQAYQEAANQLGPVQSSCQSSVQQCSSVCGQALAAVQQCPAPEVRQRAARVQEGQQSCSSGSLARRPQEIAQTSQSLRQVGAGDASRCNQDSLASTKAAEPGRSPDGRSGPVAQDPAVPGGGPGPGGDTSGNFASQPGTNPTANEVRAAVSGAGVEEVYDVSGRNALSNGTGTLHAPGSDSLAALPGTPAQSENSEETEAQGGKESGLGGSGTYAGAGRGARKILTRRKAAALAAEGESMKAAGKEGEETPDLNSLLPSGRQVAGSVISVPDGCRIPDPADPRKCAIHHGPAANIWAKMKERFELLRNALPPLEYFFREE